MFDGEKFRTHTEDKDTVNLSLCLSKKNMRYFANPITTLPVPVTALSKTRIVLDHSNSGFVGANPTRGMDVRGCIQKFPDWQPGARTANDTALCH
jgi:hypothetical protein